MVHEVPAPLRLPRWLPVKLRWQSGLLPLLSVVLWLKLLLLWLSHYDHLSKLEVSGSSSVAVGLCVGFASELFGMGAFECLDCWGDGLAVHVEVLKTFYMSKVFHAALQEQRKVLEEPISKFMSAFKQCGIGASVAFRIDVHADIPRAKDAVDMPTVA